MKMRLLLAPALVYFKTAAECLSIREASRQLNVASSAITRQIARVETVLGYKLFDRRSRRLALTPAGRILLSSVQRAVEPIEEALQKIAILGDRQTGTLRIASVDSVSLSLVPQLVARLGEVRPSVRIEIAVAPSEEVHRLVSEGLADIGFAFATSDEPDLHIAAEGAVGAVFRRDHPLAGVTSLTMRDVARYKIALPRSSMIRAIVDGMLAKEDCELGDVIESTSIPTLMELAKTAGCVGILTDFGTRGHLLPRELTFVPFSGEGTPHAHIAIIRKSGRKLPPGSQEFLDLATAMLEAPTSSGERSLLPRGAAC